MYYLFNYPLVRRYILKLKHQFFYHKHLKLILLLILTISIIWSTYNIVAWIANTYSVSYIVITGKRYYTTNHDICHIIKKLDTLKIFMIRNIDFIQKQIECLPWIQQVSIRIQCPDTLRIHVIEHIPVAFWNDSYIVGATGIIFNIPEEYKSVDNIITIPMLYGPKGSEQEILMYYYIFDAILKESTKLQIKSLQMDARHSWKLMLKNNMYVKLGRINIIERINYFVKIYPIILYKISEGNKYIDYVDLRYTAGFVVKWIPNVITPVFCKK